MDRKTEHRAEARERRVSSITEVRERKNPDLAAMGQKTKSGLKGMEIGNHTEAGRGEGAG